jgi:TolA-binding protein
MNKHSLVRSMTVTDRSARPAKVTAAIVVAGCAIGLAACSSGPSTSSSTHTAAPRTTSPATTPAPTGTGTASQATCKHVNSLRGSLESLSHMQLSVSSQGQIRSNVSNIETQLTELKGHATGALSHQVNQLSTSVNEVKKAASNLSTPPSSSQITKIVTALSGLKTQTKSAVPELNAACPKS